MIFRKPGFDCPQYGYTLIELILVLILLGILAAVALPRFSSHSDFEKRLFFDEVLTALRYAQKLAVATGCEIQFTVNNNQYAIYRDNSCTSGNFSSPLPVINPATGEAGYTGRQTGVTLTASHRNTVFYPVGRASVDNLITVGSRKITIVAATGFSYDSSP